METLSLKAELFQQIADDHFRTASYYAQQAQYARDELIKITHAVESINVKEKYINGSMYQVNTHTGVWYNTTSGDTVIDPNSTEFVYDWCYAHGDDYETLPPGTPISHVIERCIELGSRAFITNKDNTNTYYIRTPPNIKPRARRDYNSIKKCLEETRTNGKNHHKYNAITYILNY